MMLTLVIGMGIIAGILFYVSFSLEKKHFLLQLLCIIFALLSLNIMTATMVESRSECTTELSNTTIIGNVTDYQYSQVCQTRELQSPVTLFKVMTWFLRLFLTYVVIYFFIEVITYIKESVSKK